MMLTVPQEKWNDTSERGNKNKAPKSVVTSLTSVNSHKDRVQKSFQQKF